MKQTALITGASTGIGYELAKVFAANGFGAVLIARNHAKLGQVAEELQEKFSVHAHVLPKDLSLPSAAQEIYDWCKSRALQINVLVNNAGFGAYGDFVDSDLHNILEMIQVNVTALVHLTKLFLPDLLQQASARILNVTSTAAFQPGPRMAIYYATKAFVLSFSEALASECVGSGLTVTALCPGPTATEFQARANVLGTRLVKTGLMRADKVALAGYRGMMKGKRVVIPGIVNKLAVMVVRFAPRRAVAAIVKARH